MRPPLASLFQILLAIVHGREGTNGKVRTPFLRTILPAAIPDSVLRRIHWDPGSGDRRSHVHIIHRPEVVPLCRIQPQQNVEFTIPSQAVSRASLEPGGKFWEII